MAINIKTLITTEIIIVIGDSKENQPTIVIQGFRYPEMASYIMKMTTCEKTKDRAIFLKPQGIKCFYLTS